MLTESKLGDRYSLKNIYTSAAFFLCLTYAPTVFLTVTVSLSRFLAKRLILSSIPM